MRASKLIKETDLIAELISAQGAGDRFAESKAIVALSRITHPIPRGNNRERRTTLERFFDKVVLGASDCWYWRGALNQHGYGLMNALGESKAHRVSYRLFKEVAPGDLDVLHKCDVRNCVNPDHLFLGTQADNVRDMVNKGRFVVNTRRGEESHFSKLTKDQVLEMRRIRKEHGLSYAKIAAMFGVNTMTAHRAITGTSWRTV